MNLILISAFIAVCGAAKLDRTYLPPSAASSGGSPGSLQAPLTRTSEQGLETPNSPTGSYINDFGGVVVDAAAPGTRSSESISGLGGPRPSYGSSNSKVGDAAFRGSAAGFRDTQFASGQIGTEVASGQSGNNGNSFQNQFDTHSAQGFIGQTGSQTGQFSNQGFSNFENKSERPQAAKDRNSNILSQSNDVDADRYSYGFETDNGIIVGENGVDVNGIQAEGGYSYQGDDGQVYKVTYVADEKGYRPQGAHLPTPPPIPDEILKSLEQNAQAEAAGLIDDGSYDAQKYNTDSDYTHDNSGNIQHNGGQLSQFGKRPESAGTFNNQNNQAFGTAGSTGFGLTSQTQGFDGQLSQTNVIPVGAVPSFGSNQDRFGVSGSQTSFNGQGSQVNSQSGSSQFSSGSQDHSNIGQSSQANQFISNLGSAQHANFGQSHSRPLTGHENSVSGHAFGQTGNEFPSSHTQDAFRSQSQFGSQLSQQASASALFEKKTPESGSTQNQQVFNTHFASSKPSSGQYYQGASNSAHSQSTQPESGTSFKPQGSEAFSGASLNHNQDAQDFGKPFPQDFNGENFNRPSSGNINSKPTFGQGQVNKGSASGFNRFPQPSGQFVTQNEYLPPSNNNQPQHSKSEASVLSSNSGVADLSQEPQMELSPTFVALNKPKPNFASASASTFSQSTFQPQPARPLNTFDAQPKPNQLNQQTTQFTQQTSQPSSQTQFNTNSQQSSSFAAQSSDVGTKPTAVPDTELTTPLEPNEKSASQSSQFPSQTTPSFGSFTSKPASQGQAQLGLKENSAFGLSTGETLAPSVPTSSSQFDSALPQSEFHSTVGMGPRNTNGNPQFPQNAFGQTQQNQPSSGQGIDNSYYYNQPSKPFGAVVLRPQGSRFPSSPSDQSNGVVSQNQFFNKQSFQNPAKLPASSLSPVGATSATQSTQTQGYKGITQAAISSFPSVFPTQSSQIGMRQTTQFGSKPSFNQQSNGIQAQSTGAQLSYSQQSTTGNRAQENFQFGSVGTQVQSTGTQPSYNHQSTFSNQAQPTSNQARFPPASGFPSGQKTASTGPQTEPQVGLIQASKTSESSSQQTVQTQQYQGTIYEYNKPAEVLPATQTDSSSGQISGSPESMPSFSQSQNIQQNTESLSQGSESNFDVQGNKPFGSLLSSSQFGQQAQTSQGSQISQSTGMQFGSQPAKPFAQFGQSAQSSSDGSSAQQNNQELQSAQSFKPFGSTSQDNQSPFGSKTQFDSQSNQFSQNTQSFGNRQPQNTASQHQLSSQNSQNFASSQGNGYIYPENPKPQFGEDSKTQFIQNSQPGRPQTGFTNQFNSVQQGNSQPTIFNQQQQFNSASRPQFGAQNIKNTQATFGQRLPNPIQPFIQQQLRPSSASSQAFATGQGTASASAYSSDLERFVSQDKTQSQIQTDTQDQSGQGTQVGQSTKPFGTQESKEPGSKVFGSSPSKPLFKSACCHASKDSTPSQSTDRPSSSFPGAQGFNAETLSGKGEQFGGPRQPPSFDDQTGYHY